MAGTEGTGEYRVIAATKLGRVGFRPLICGSFRIRVEPRDQAVAEALSKNFPTGEWKQPGSQFRFSTVSNAKAVRKSLAVALKAIGSTAKIGPINAKPNTAPSVHEPSTSAPAETAEAQ